MSVDIIDVEQWLGNRGLSEGCNFYKDKAMSKLRRNKVQGNWLFIQSDYGYGKEDIEVEAYYLNDMYGECYDAWPSKGFSWSAANLEKKVEGLEK